MMRRIVRQLGWMLWLIDVMTIITGIIMFTRTTSSDQIAGLLGTYSLVIAFLAFPVIGALIISRRPENTIGWIFCAIGLGTAFTSFSAAFEQTALVNHTDAAPIVGVITVLGNMVWPMNLALGTWLLFLFPTGRLPSPRWRLVFWLDVVVSVGSAMISLVTPGYLESGNRIWNPLGIVGTESLIAMLNNVGGPIFIFCALASLISIIVRYVKSRDTQRQQIKWFALGAVAMAAVIIVSIVVIPEENWLSNVTFALGIVMLPIGAGIGVLRYRLFDIDVIINRTLVYGSLTAILAAIYFAGVVGVQSLVNIVTRHELTNVSAAQSPVLIVVTTLLIAALFTPLRRRIQQFIDRRFYRSRYDARKTLDRFATSLRSEVELHHLTESLLETVEQTMQPAHASLWLRMPESER